MIGDKRSEFVDAGSMGDNSEILRWPCRCHGLDRGGQIRFGMIRSRGRRLRCGRWWGGRLETCYIGDDGGVRWGQCCCRTKVAAAELWEEWQSAPSEMAWGYPPPSEVGKWWLEASVL
jgi:hypothetical protein